jgi:hypothetical protein
MHNLSNDKGIFNEPLPSNDRRIFTEPLPSNDKGTFTEPLPSNDRSDTQTHTHGQQRDLISLLLFFQNKENRLKSITKYRNRLNAAPDFKIKFFNIMSNTIRIREEKRKKERETILRIENCKYVAYWFSSLVFRVHEM